MNSVDQSIFPRTSLFPPTVNIRRFSVRQAGDAVAHLIPKQRTSYIVPIGIAFHTSDVGEVDFISLANTSTALLILFDEKKPHIHRDFAALLSAGGNAPVKEEWRSCLVGFSMARTAVQVSRATQVRVRGVDLNTMDSTDTWAPKPPAEAVAKNISADVDKWKINLLWLGSRDSAETDICMQAWLAACSSVGNRCLARVHDALRVDTTFINISERDCLGIIIAQVDLLDRHRSKEMPNDFSKASMNKSGKVEIVNSRYKTRVRRGNQTQIIMTDASGREFVGHARGTKGKTTTVEMRGKNDVIGGQFQHVRIVGRQEPTNSEKAREELIHLLLTGQRDLRQSPFIRAIWFPKWKATTPICQIDVADLYVAEDMVTSMKLNESQRGVVLAMVGDLPVMVAHGPPGTGKTTTISVASRIWCYHNFAVWIVAHSNVAVKNIAESLSKQGVDFKLLVSKEFYEEWHEHLYAGVEERLIRSDELPEDSDGMARKLGHSRIILCTLSMVSNPMLQENGTFKIIPMERLIIDEASQINIIEFMHIFQRFEATLGKVCFFGDPKQLPPFGKEHVRSMETIFDIKHISSSKNDFFLDTQYRMPVHVGDFISTHVYGGRLKSEHLVQHDKCVTFIDVPPPRSVEAKAGFSWKNEGEIETLVHLVKFYYQHLNFCIITPYDGQRAAIQRALEAEDLPAESVYNLDSFQGNEADYILISVVRSEKPGFLVSQNRMNVLLTRCKKAMIIVTSRPFIRSGGSDTLLGTLAAHWGRKRGTPWDIWTDWRLVANGTVDLPGALGRNRNKQATQPIPSSEAVLTSVHPTHHRILFNKSLPWVGGRIWASPNPQQSPEYDCIMPSIRGRTKPPKLWDEALFPALSSRTKGSASSQRNAIAAAPHTHSFLLKRPAVHHGQTIPTTGRKKILPKAVVPPVQQRFQGGGTASSERNTIAAAAPHIHSFLLKRPAVHHGQSVPTTGRLKILPKAVVWPVQQQFPGDIPSGPQARSKPKFSISDIGYQSQTIDRIPTKPVALPDPPLRSAQIGPIRLIRHEYILSQGRHSTS